MDHLPIPRNPVQEYKEVSYLSHVEYDGGPIASYPERVGWSTRPLAKWFDTAATQKDDIEAVLQTWLFFGMLDKVLNRRISIQEFVVQKEGRSVLTTALLPEIIEKWMLQKREEFAHDPQAQEKLVDTIGNDMFEVGSILAGLDLMKTDRRSQFSERTLAMPTELMGFIRLSPIERPLDSQIFMCVHLLWLFLYAAILEVLSPLQQDRMISVCGNWAGAAGWVRISRSKLQTEMIHAGWCTFEVATLDANFSAFGLYFFRHMERPRPDRIHKDDFDAKTHRRIPGPRDVFSIPEIPENPGCTVLYCDITRLDKADYQTKHIEGCHGCWDVIADLDHLCSILKGGTFPIIAAVGEDDTGTQAKIVANSDNLSYIAISHVWSDGLGNPRENSLPRCQMVRLSKLVRELPGATSRPTYFWMDTLCCPSKDKAAQTLAISMMRDTYASAQAVLVLDSWLETSQVGDLSDHEILMRIFASGWNTRLWTLQEGALARELIFKFADSYYEMEGGLDRMGKNTTLTQDLCLKGDVRRGFRDFRGFRLPGTDMCTKIVAVDLALRCRTTSVVADEAICIATLLDLDVTQIVKTPGEGRMLQLWYMLSTVPAIFIFFEGYRIKEKGFRWAPRTFLRGPSFIKFVDKNYLGGTLKLGSPTPRGLLVQYPGMILKPWPGQILLHSSSCRFRDEKGNWYNMSLALDTTKILYQRMINSNLDVSMSSHQWPDSLALITHFDLSASDIREVYGALVLVIEQSKSLQLVEDNQEMQSIIYARFIRGVRLRKIVDMTKDDLAFKRHGNAYIRRREAAERTNTPFVEDQQEKIPLLLAETKSEEQFWCVD